MDETAQVLIRWAKANAARLALEMDAPGWDAAAREEKRAFDAMIDHARQLAGASVPGVQILGLDEGNPHPSPPGGQDPR